MSRNRIVIVVVLLLIIVVGIAALVVYLARDFGLDDAQAFAGAPLPPGAINVQYATIAEPGRVVWLRFDLPPDADLDVYLTQIEPDLFLEAGFTPFPAPNPQEAGLTWWTPQQVTAFSGVYHNTGDRVLELLVDRSDAARLIVYLRAYSLRSG